MDSLLIEIGTEEIPAGYIAPALKAFSAQLVACLDQARIGRRAPMVLRAAWR